MQVTPIQISCGLSQKIGVDLRIKRDDFFPMSGGGNKARKIWYIVDYAIKNGYDALVTNGGIQSNHARAAALASAEKGLECKLVLHGDTGKAHKLEGNLLLMHLADADIEVVSLSQLSEAMDRSMEELRAKGLNPLYVWGGGHCVQGALAYYEAVKEFKKQAGNWEPDYVLFASGTGTTQAGLAVGFADRNIKVIGVSVAREKERGEAVVRSAVDELADYLGIGKNIDVYFRDDWICGGYEKFDDAVVENINMAAKYDALILDPTYTGKAFTGLVDMVNNGEIAKGSKVLFWHTGGILNLMSSERFTEMVL